MSSWQIALNVKNVESNVSIANNNGNKITEQKIKVPPTDYINLQLMIHSFWKDSVKDFNLFNLRNSLPKKVWAKEEKVFLFTSKEKLSNGLYGDIQLATRFLRYCFVNNLLLLPGYWNKLENLVKSFSYAFISGNEKLVKSSKFKTDKLHPFCIKSTNKISFYDPHSIISDKFNFFWNKNGTPRLGKHILKKELFDKLWNNPTNITFNKTSISPNPKKKTC